jgi:hypothetical protein
MSISHLSAQDDTSESAFSAPLSVAFSGALEVGSSAWLCQHSCTVTATSGLQGAWSILHLYRLVTSPRFTPSHSHSRFELAPEMMGFTRRATTTANLNHVLDQHLSQKTKDATLFVND